MAILKREPIEEIATWEPFRSMDYLHREMNRLFERMMPRDGGGGSLAAKALNFVPSAELEDADDAICIRLEVPGMEAKDIDVELAENFISIKGERKSESKSEEKGYVRSEFQYGKFERRIPLPTHVQADKAKAECRNGVLKLNLPKVEKEQRNKAVKLNIS
jgi:HSP20 family protein